jgi:hypothetical protein
MIAAIWYSLLAVISLDAVRLLTLPQAQAQAEPPKPAPNLVQITYCNQIPCKDAYQDIKLRL